MSSSYIWAIDKTQSSTIIESQSGPGNDVNEGVLHIPHSSSITGASISDCLMSYQDIRKVVYSYAEMQSVYSTTLADWGANWITI